MALVGIAINISIALPIAYCSPVIAAAASLRDPFG
jgi:hypothetical protein